MTRFQTFVTIAGLAFAAAPSFAGVEERINGAFTVAFATAINTANATYCGASTLPLIAQANGAGYTSRGSFSFELHKTMALPGAMQGCVTLRAANGDTLLANYRGTIDTPDGTLGHGTLSFTGGTGRYEGASGSVNFTAVFFGLYPALTVFGQPSPLPQPVCSDMRTTNCLQASIQGTAFYVLEGAISIP